IERFRSSLFDHSGDDAKVIALNSAFSLYAKGVEDVDRAYSMAIEAIKSGLAGDTFRNLVGE
ncbi:MAG: hypothetical protein ACP5I5_03930, partial [Thermosulfidibacteraceae bacterium]